MKPTQPARYFAGLSTNTNFDREYLNQSNVPVDGSNNWLRTLSPFVIRALPPLIFGQSSDTLRVEAPTLSSPDEGVTESASPVSYSRSLLGVNRRDPSADTYRDLLAIGQNIPGMGVSIRDIESAYNNISVTQAASNRFGTASTRITPAITNNPTGLSILLQLRRLVDTPPLVLLINPSSLSLQYNKIAQFQERSRYGYIYQAWGEELAKLSVSCKVGAFTSGRRTVNSPTSSTNETSGVQFASKNDSAAFQQLMSVLTIFQSSAYIVDTVGRSKANYMVGNIAIEYDQNVYVGHMDSFNYSYDEMEQNGGMTFEFEFTVIRTYDTATPKTFISPLTNPNTGQNAARAGGTQSRLSRTWRNTQNPSEVQFFTAPTIGTSPNIPSFPQEWRDETVAVSNFTAPLPGQPSSRTFSTFDRDRTDLIAPASDLLNFSPVSPEGDPVYVASNRVATVEVPVLEDEVTYEAETSTYTSVPNTVLRPDTYTSATRTVPVPVLTSRR